MKRMLLIPAALLLLLAGAMWWSAEVVDKPADFTFINRGDIGTLDLNSMSWLQDIRVAYALWEGLYTLHPETLEPILGSAGKVDLDDSRTVYTFHLRTEARWTNGDDLVAADYIFAWRRMLEQPGEYTYLLHYIRGAQQYSEAFAAHFDSGKPLPDFATVGVKALSPKTLQVSLRHPVTFFPDLCAFPPFFPLHAGSMERFKQVDPATGRVSYDPRFTRPPHLVSNGPYRLESWQIKNRLRMVASEHYWDRANVRSRIIDMLSFADPRTAFLKYETGGVDWVAEVTAEDAAELRAIGRKDLRVFPGFGTYFYSVNCLPKLPDGRENPFADVRVRKALSMAVDKRPIVDNITRLGQPVATQYVPPGIFRNYASPPGLPYNIAEARRLLAEAGYPGGKGFPERIVILYNKETPEHRYIAQIVARQWQEQLGISLGLEGVEINTFRVRLHGKDYAIARASWIGDYNDVSTFTDKYLSNSQNNDSGWVNARYDELCAQAAVEGDLMKRLGLLSQAEKILLDEAPIINLYHYVNAYLYPDTVTGVSLDPRNQVMFKAVHVRRER